MATAGISIANAIAAGAIAAEINRVNSAIASLTAAIAAATKWSIYKIKWSIYKIELDGPAGQVELAGPMTAANSVAVMQGLLTGYQNLLASLEAGLAAAPVN